MEPGLDWDLWLGPAPVRAYNSVLSPRGVYDAYIPHWRMYREYGGGMVTDWGAHHLDIAQWGLGMDDSGPVEALPPKQPGAKRGAKLVYANGVVVEHKDGFGVDFFGSEGEVQVNRGTFTFRRGKETIASFTNQPEREEHPAPRKCRRPNAPSSATPRSSCTVSKNHLWNFLDCVRSRQKPITSEQVGGRSAICCHLMNQAYFHGRKMLVGPGEFRLRRRHGRSGMAHPPVPQPLEDCLTGADGGWPRPFASCRTAASSVQRSAIRLRRLDA